MVHTAYKFRLYPTATQTRALSSQLETLRQVYNAVLAYRKELYVEEKKSLKRGDLNKLVISYRKLQIAHKKAGGAGPFWLTQVSAVSIRDTCKRVEVAFDNFFRRVKQKAGKVGYPRFKSFGRLTSIPFDNYASGCTLRDETGRTIKANAPLARKGYRLDLFGVGQVKVLVHRSVVGKIKTACVKRDVDGKWYVVLVAQHDVPVPVPSTNPAGGIDVGLERFVTTSDGNHYENPRFLKRKLKELRRLQRAASRKIEVAKGRRVKFRECKNLQKEFVKVVKLHVRVRNLRKENHHQVANLLVREYGTVCVEKLNIRGMKKNDKLARSISDAAWGGFLIVLKHKAAKAGVRFVEVDARGTSQTCPECGRVEKKTLKQRKHTCPCGYETHRDHAAARVILARGVGGAGSVPVVHKPVGMPSEQSGGERVGRRNSLTKSVVSDRQKPNLSRRGSKTPPTPESG